MRHRTFYISTEKFNAIISGKLTAYHYSDVLGVGDTVTFKDMAAPERRAGGEVTYVILMNPTLFYFSLLGINHGGGRKEEIKADLLSI